MGDNNKREIIIWPEYFLAELTRRLGRRVPRELALRDIKPEELIEACRVLFKDCEVEVIKGKKYPRVWYISKGWYAILRVGGSTSIPSKNGIIRELARVILNLRKGKT